MSAQNIRRRISRRALIPAFSLMTVTPLMSCSKDGDPISDVDEFARFDADVYLYNVRTVYADNGAFGPGGSAHLTIPGAGENPPCCLVIEGNARSTEIRVLHGEEWFIRSYAGRPGSVNFNQWNRTAAELRPPDRRALRRKNLSCLCYMTTEV